MNIKKCIYNVVCKIFANFTFSILCTLIFYNSISAESTPNKLDFEIEVFAGYDTVLCRNFNFDLAGLNASITGDVADGIWFSTGDGYFLPDNETYQVFSIATTYVPGILDKSNGKFELILVSDDPDGVGPGQEQSDKVLIKYQISPPLVCVADVALSINEDCSQPANIYMFIQNPVPPFSYYQIALFTEEDVLIPDNIIDSEHIGQFLQYEITYLCNNNICSGEIFIEDKIPPSIYCQDVTVDCIDSYEPESIGFPVPPDVSITAIGDGVYTVQKLDACSSSQLSYSDQNVNQNCPSGIYTIVNRTWLASDNAGNSSTCVQKIYLKSVEFEEFLIPSNFDNISEPSLYCDGDWIRLSNGHPSPETTGYPDLGFCYYLEYTYSDITFPLCGSGFKILREWLIVDWCSAESYEAGQIIKVIDNEAPNFTCPSDITIGSNPYECQSDDFLLPLPQNVEDCSNWSLSIIIKNSQNQQSFPVVNLNNDQYMVDNLPVGEYIATYYFSDVCNNLDSCKINILVRDDDPPFAICDDHTTISLSSNGLAQLYAVSLDDGSLDNCGIVKYEAAKMSDICFDNTDFGPYVEFCCEEAGETIMVQFKVTDANGQYNICMVEVRVAEKIPPKIVCPSDLTISCDFSYNPADLSVFGSVHDNKAEIESIHIYDEINNGVVGQDGYIQDNCGASVEEFVNIQLVCSQGYIERKFIVSDMYGQLDSCIQTIHFVNASPFQELDILWPENKILEGCSSYSFEPDSTGYPTYLNEDCSQIDESYEDDVFVFVQDACKKIIRRWSVIDWCQYNSVTGAGLWTHDQIIKINNTEGPEFSGSCQDTILCLFGDGCTDIIRIEQAAFDECTPADELDWRWDLDLNLDGVFDMYGLENVMETELSIGEYHIKWTVEDGCGNISVCEYDFEVVDCKEPSPYCISFLTTVVMNEVGEVTVWASDFNFDSYDNCTSPDELIYSFSNDTTNQYQQFTCDDIYNGIAHSFPLEIWVTDEAGNQDFCQVVITVQDNSDVCEDHHGEGIVEGIVATPSGQFISDCELSLNSNLENYTLTSFTNADGQYLIEEIPQFLNYELSAYRAGPANEGVSTLDMLVIQRHILGFNEIIDPYRLIAADINKSNSISVVDLVQLRKAILGIETKFPNNKNWIFIPKDFEFADEENPWFYDESIVIESLEGTFEAADFIGIKIGDVNQSFSSSFQNQVENRNSHTNLELELIENENDFQVDLYIDGTTNVYGFQFALSFPSMFTLESIESKNEQINDSNFSWSVLEENVLAFSWSDPSSFQANEKHILSLHFEKEDHTPNLQNIVGFSALMSPEVYTDEGTELISLNWREKDLIDESFLVQQNYPNPFSSVCFVPFLMSESNEVEFVIYDIYGRDILTKVKYYESGSH